MILHKAPPIRWLERPPSTAIATREFMRLRDRVAPYRHDKYRMRNCWRHILRTKNARHSTSTSN